MAKLEISVAIANLRIARMHPCAAVVDATGTLCGATPASLYRRTCGVASHDDNTWLCPVHAGMVATGMAICRRCADRGGVTGIATIERLTEPIRISQ